MESHYPFTLPPLPYGYDALLPEIGERTLHFHHDKHFSTYIDNLNKLLEKHPAAQDWPLERLIQEWPSLPEDIRQGVRNNAGGVYNHDLYFKTMAPGPAASPSGALESAINRGFGDLDGLKAAGAVWLRLVLAGQRWRRAAIRGENPQPGYAPAPDAAAAVRRVGACLLPGLPEPTGGLF